MIPESVRLHNNSQHAVSDHTDTDTSENIKGWHSVENVYFCTVTLGVYRSLITN